MEKTKQKGIEEFLTKNRAEIDEFLGPNQEIYATIALKGKLSSEIGRTESFKYFEYWLKLELTPKETNEQIRLILDTITKRGKDISVLTPEEKEIYLKIMREEFI